MAGLRNRVSGRWQGNVCGYRAGLETGAGRALLCFPWPGTNCHALHRWRRLLHRSWAGTLGGGHRGLAAPEAVSLLTSVSTLCDFL